VFSAQGCAFLGSLPLPGYYIKLSLSPNPRSQIRTFIDIGQIMYLFESNKDTQYTKANMFHFRSFQSTAITIVLKAPQSVI